MTKSEMLAEISVKLSASEIETLGLTEFSTLKEIKSIYAQLPKETNPPFDKDKGLTQAASEGTTEEHEEGKETKTDETPEESKTEGADQFDELLGRVKSSEVPPTKEKEKKPLITTERKKRKKGEASPDSFRIEGYILLLATDTVFPMMLSVINNLIDKKHPKIKAEQLQLSQKDFDKLEPLADQAASFLSVNLNPVAGFVLVSAFMYTNNMIAIKANLEPVK
jgi:hypothetical protein